MGNGSSLPVRHVGSVLFPSYYMPLSLNNVVVSPQLIKNLVSIRSFTRENLITMEFDELGFSVKDARTRMVLHHYDNPDNLYPAQPSSSSIS